MLNEIGISSASFCLWEITPREKISICKELGFTRIEIALSTKKMLRQFVESIHLLDDLKAFRNITVHAPWQGVTYGDNTRTKAISSIFRTLSKMINIDAFIVHFDRISDFAAIDFGDTPILIENSEKEGSWPLLENFIEVSGCSCVLNINRATRNDNYLDRIIMRFESLFKAVYVSGFDRQHYRTPIIDSGQGHVLAKAKNIKAPFIIEGLFPPGDYISILREKELIERFTGHLSY